MKLGGLSALREALGGDVGDTYLSALKKAAGITTRKFDVERAVEWLRNNPDFQVRDVFPDKRLGGHELHTTRATNGAAVSIAPKEP